MKALLLLTDGSEEMEAVISSDILCRAGVSVFRAAVGVTDLTVTGANGQKLQADLRLEEMAEGEWMGFEVLVLPGGGKGSKTFCRNELVQRVIKAFAAHDSARIAAICAAPWALREAAIFPGARVTCYPGMEATVCRDGHFVHDPSRVTVVDGRLITGKGPGTAFDFALTVVEELLGGDVRARVSKDCLL